MKKKYSSLSFFVRELRETLAKSNFHSKKEKAVLFQCSLDLEKNICNFKTSSLLIASNRNFLGIIGAMKKN